jgi:hypothetical protein
MATNPTAAATTIGGHQRVRRQVMRPKAATPTMAAVVARVSTATATRTMPARLRKASSGDRPSSRPVAGIGRIQCPAAGGPTGAGWGVGS